MDRSFLQFLCSGMSYRAGGMAESTKNHWYVTGMWLSALDAFSRHPSTFRLLKQPHRVWNTQQAVSQMRRLKLEVVHHFAKTC